MTRHHAGPLSIFLVVSTAAVIISLIGVFILKSPFQPDHVIVSRREVMWVQDCCTSPRHLVISCCAKMFCFVSAQLERDAWNIIANVFSSQAIGSLLSLEISDRVYLTLRSAAGDVTNVGSLANNLTLLGKKNMLNHSSNHHHHW